MLVVLPMTIVATGICNSRQRVGYNVNRSRTCCTLKNRFVAGISGGREEGTDNIASGVETGKLVQKATHCHF